MPPLISPTEVFFNDEIARFLAVMRMTDPDLLELCQALQVMFWCMPGDRPTSFLLSDIRNRLKTLLYQRPDFYEAVKIFRGYVGLQEAFEDYGQIRPKQLAVDVEI